MRPETEQTIREAWAQLLGEEGTPLEGMVGGGDRLVRVRESADTVSFVRLFGQGVLSGPSWALERAVGRSDDELALLPVLMGLAADHGARPLGAAELSYTDAPVEHADLPTTQDGAAVAALEAACSPEDVAEVDLGRMTHRWVILDRAGEDGGASGDAESGDEGSGEDQGGGKDPGVTRSSGDPLAGAGYVVWADRLAHMGVLTSPHARGRGYGVLAAAVGTNAALDAGLVPQWRSRWDNEASKRVAQVLGYELVGTQTTVFVNPH